MNLQQIMRMKLLLGGSLLFWAGGCQPSVVRQEQGEKQPLVYHERGASAYVDAVEIDDELIAVDLTVINGTEREITVCSKSNPLTLQDDKGGQYTSATDDVKLPAFSTNDLVVNFKGPLKDDAEKLSLRINPKFGSDYNAPQLTISDIPVNAAGRLEFARPAAASSEIADATINHANGVTFTVQKIDFDADAINVAFEAVNGHKSDVALAASNSDPAYLQDDQGRRYYLIPPSSNADLKIPARQKMNGVLRFAGRLAPTASRLNLNINGRYGSSADYANSPKLVLPDILVKR